LEGFAVVDELETGIEIAVMAQPTLDVLGAELDFLEDGRVWLEFNQRAIRVGVLAFLFVLEFALLERGLDELAFAMATDEKIFGERVDGFGANAVQADAELEDVIVVFRAGVDLGDALDYLPAPMMYSSTALSMTSLRRM
jgi:hypothetical protein